MTEFLVGLPVVLIIIVTVVMGIYLCSFLTMDSPTPFIDGFQLFMVGVLALLFGAACLVMLIVIAMGIGGAILGAVG